MIEYSIAVLLILGGFFCFIAGLGLLRLPDILVRLHASTKAGTLGVGLNVAAVILADQNPVTAAKAISIILFIMITSPVAAHMIGCSVYKNSDEKLYFSKITKS